MLVKDLKQLLAKAPDEAEVLVWLNYDNPEPLVTHLEASYYRDAKACAPAEAQAVALIEPVEPDEARGFVAAVRLGLPQEFVDLCEELGVEPQEVLHGFVADVCELQNYVAQPRKDGLGSHGADERMLARQYFDRCGYGR